MRSGLAIVPFAAPLLATLALGACLPGSGPPLSVYQDDAGTPPPTNLPDDAGATRTDVDLGDPFALIGLNPSHGPFTGGTRAIVAGRGFSSRLRVFVGGAELPAASIFASDPTRAAIVTPPGNPGPADVKIRDDATARERTLPAGFVYDAFVVQPASGATTGGTRVTLVGSGTTWTASTTVAVDGHPCTALAVADATHLACTTPAGSPGTKDVVTTNSDGSILQARDAFTYSDSPDGFRGGLFGSALGGTVRVLAFDAWVGQAIPGAHAIAGGLHKLTDSAGIAEISDPSLTGKVTVTIAAKCHQPTTFVDVPVDTVTAYLTPTLDPSCASGDPPSTGNNGGTNGGLIDGELIWPNPIEFKRSAWTNVPDVTRPTERRVAYVLQSAYSPFQPFYLPSAASAITPDSPGRLGYQYEVGTGPGNVTLYAVAGIEDRSVSPPKFTAYAMGVVRGVPVTPSTKTTGVDIPMTTILDHEVVLTPLPPPPGARGPDRYQSILAVSLGQSAYAPLPTGQSTTLLPLSGNVAMVGIPALDGALGGEQYVLTGTAATGPYLQVPASVVTRITTRDANNAVVVGGFMGVPQIQTPGAGTWSGTSIAVGSATAASLMRIDVESGNGFSTWTIVSPGTLAFTLPDLGQYPGAGLVRGTIVTTVYLARIDQLDYGRLRYGQMGTGGWNAYAVDQVTGSY